MKRGEWGGPSSEHEAVYHAAAWSEKGMLR
jgi:hypothetical protein